MCFVISCNMYIYQLVQNSFHSDFNPEVAHIDK